MRVSCKGPRRIKNGTQDIKNIGQGTSKKMFLRGPQAFNLRLVWSTKVEVTASEIKCVEAPPLSLRRSDFGGYLAELEEIFSPLSWRHLDLHGKGLTLIEKLFGLTEELFGRVTSDRLLAGSAAGQSQKCQHTPKGNLFGIHH